MLLPPLLLACTLGSSAGLPVAEAGPAAPAGKADTRAVAERIRAALAAPDRWAWTDARASVKAVGRYELVPGRQTYAPEPTPAAFDVVVVSDEGAVVRIVEEQDGVRFVLGVPREDLATRPVARTRLADSPARAGRVDADDAFVELAGGTAVVLSDRASGATRVSWSDEGLATAGWAPDKALDAVWREDPVQIGGEWANLALQPLEPGAPVSVPLHARPDFGSPTLATLTPDVALRLFAAGEPKDGWTPVEAITTNARAVGWAPPGRVKASEPYGLGFGGMTGPPPLRGALVALPAGTWLRPRAATEPFARTVRETRVALLKEEGERIWVGLRSPWGTLTAEADCPRPTREDGLLRCGAPAP